MRDLPWASLFHHITFGLALLFALGVLFASFSRVIHLDKHLIQDRHVICSECLHRITLRAKCCNVGKRADSCPLWTSAAGGLVFPAAPPTADS